MARHKLDLGCILGPHRLVVACKLARTSVDEGLLRIALAASAEEHFLLVHMFAEAVSLQRLWAEEHVQAVAFATERYGSAEQLARTSVAEGPIRIALAASAEGRLLLPHMVAEAVFLQRVWAEEHFLAVEFAAERLLRFRSFAVAEECFSLALAEAAKLLPFEFAAE